MSFVEMSIIYCVPLSEGKWRSNAWQAVFKLLLTILYGAIAILMFPVPKNRIYMFEFFVKYSCSIGSCKPSSPLGSICTLVSTYIVLLYAKF